ncbi:unnamed protein product [Ectocarpus sp. 12 AP-2014]
MASDDVWPASASQPRRNLRSPAAMQGGVVAPAAAPLPSPSRISSPGGTGAADVQQQVSLPRRRRPASAARMHDGHADDATSSGGESEGLDRAGGAGDAGSGGDMDSKRRRRLELNRKAAKESRRRKKMRIEELGRSVVFLTRENQELREQNEIFRQMVASEVSTDGKMRFNTKFRAENAALRMALYEADKTHGSSSNRLHQPKQDMEGGAAGAGSRLGKSPTGLSLSEHPMSGPVPSLAAAAAAVGNARPSSSSGMSSSSHSLLASLPPPPPGGSGGAGGDKMSSSPTSSLHSSPSTSAASMMMSSSLPQHLSSTDGKVNGGSINGSSRVGGGSLLDGAGAAGAAGSGGVSGGGNRMIAPAGIGAPFMSGGGLGVLASLTGGGRDGTGTSQPSSGGRSLHPKSMSTFVSVPGGAAGAAAGRSTVPPHHQSSSSYGPPGYRTDAAGSRGRKLDREGGEGGGSGGLDYAEMMARASANAAMVRARSIQQQHSDSGGAGPGGGGGGASGGGVGGSSATSGPGSADSRRGQGGGWPPSWPGWEGSNAGAPPGSVERTL